MSLAINAAIINRQYDSKQGRFTQVDPIGMRAASLDDPQSLNMYAYCANDPINRLDPSGLFFGKLFKWIGKVFGAVSKVLKWVAVALVVAVAVVAIVVSPAAAFQMLRIIGKFLIKIGVFKATPLIYSAAEIGTKIGIGLVGKVLAVAAGIGAVSNHVQKKKSKKQVESQECKQHWARIFGNPQAIGALNDAWGRSQYKQSNAHEEGGLLGWGVDEGQPWQRNVYANERFSIPAGTPSIGLGPQFNVWAQQRVAAGTVGYDYWYHTHPFDQGQYIYGVGTIGDVNTPSGIPNGVNGDLGTSKLTGLLGIAVSSTSIIVFDKLGIRCTFKR